MSRPSSTKKVFIDEDSDDDAAFEAAIQASLELTRPGAIPLVQDIGRFGRISSHQFDDAKKPTFHMEDDEESAPSSRPGVCQGIVKSSQKPCTKPAIWEGKWCGRHAPPHAKKSKASTVKKRPILVNQDPVPGPKKLARMRSELWEHQVLSIAVAKERIDGILRDEPLHVGRYLIQTNLVILADPPGSGKTRVIADILHSYRDQPVPAVYEQKRLDNALKNFTVSSINEMRLIPKTLLILAPSIIKQWQLELDRYGLSYGNIPSNSYIPSSVDGLPEDADAIIVSTTCIREFWNELQLGEAAAFNMIVFDEPDTQHIPNCPDFIIGTRLFVFVTATAEGLYAVKGRSNSHFIRKMFAGLSDDVFHALMIRQTADKVANSVKLPPIEYRELRIATSQILSSIQEFASDNVAALIAKGAIHEAIAAINIHGNKNPNLLLFVRASLKREVDDSQERVDKWIEKGDNPKALAENRAMVQQHTARLNLFDSKLREALADDCCICFIRNIDKLGLCPMCYCLLCEDCLEKLPTHTCPMCRGDFEDKQLLTIPKDLKINDLEKNSNDLSERSADVHEQKVPDKQKTRLELCQNIVHDVRQEFGSGVKILIFVGEPSFEKEVVGGLSYSDTKLYLNRLTGTHSQRSDILSSFVQGKTNILVLNTKQNASGLNLSKADVVIIYNSETEQVEHQAISRAQRAGRNPNGRGLIVYRFKSD